MASSPEIGIVIAAYNAERFLPATLDSVLAQTVRDWELTLMDDGSVDATRSIAESYAARDPRIHVFSQANAGVSVARNEGYVRVSPATQLIVFLDADDVWEPAMLETLHGALREQPDAAAAYGLAREIDEHGAFTNSRLIEDHQRYRWGVEKNRVVQWPADRPTVFAVEAVQERIITGGTVLLRREALTRSGLYDPTLRMWEDWDLWLRVSRVGPILFVDEPVLRYRRHGANVSNDLEKLDAGERLIRRRLLDSLRDDPASLMIAQCATEYHLRCAAVNRLKSLPSVIARGHVKSAVKDAGASLRDVSKLLRFRYFKGSL